MADLATINDDPISKMLAFSADLATGSAVVANCPVCKSNWRKNVEQMYDEGKTFVEIVGFLQDKQDHVAMPVLRHHLKEHYKSMEAVAYLLDYCSRLEELRAKRRSREKDLEALIDVGILELTRILSIPTGSDINKEKSRSDLIQRTMHGLRESIEARNDMESKEEAVKAVEMCFAKAWKQCIDEASPEQKALYAQALREFQKVMGEQSS